MAKFSNKSKLLLSTCDAVLQNICCEAIKIMDFTIIAGYRDKITQDQAFASGNSKLCYPHSQHNKYPSQAIDIAPYPIDWNDSERFILLAGIIFGIANEHNVNIRWGGDWNGDFNLKDNKFNDLGHFEIKE